MTTPDRDRIAAAFDDELAGASLPPGFREEVVRAAVHRPQTRSRDGYPRVLALVAALLAVAIVATLVFVAKQPRVSPVKPRLVIPVAGIAFSAIAMYGEHGWGLSDTALLGTSDGGKTWTNMGPALAKTDAVVGYHAIDAKSAWLATVSADNTARVWTTSDTGRSWKSAPVPGISYLPHALLFSDGTHGWIAAPGQPLSQFSQQAIDIAATTDGGASWAVVSQTMYPPGRSTAGAPAIECGKQQMSFLNATTGWLTGGCTAGITFDATTDAGKTWKAHALATPDGKSWTTDCGAGPCSLSAPRFISPTFGYLVLFDYDSVRDAHRSTLYVTVDGGKSWDLRPVPGGDTNVRMVDASNGFAAIGDGATPTWLYRTVDGGHTWQPVQANVALQAVVLDCVSTTQCWALSEGGTTNQLFKTSDGGATWTDLSGAPPSPSPSPSPSPAGILSQTWPIGFVTAIAVTPNAVYALFVPAGTSGPMQGASNTMLARIDRTSGEVKTAGPFPGALTLAFAGASAWVGHSSVTGAAGPDSNAVFQFDGSTLKQVRKIQLPIPPNGNARVVAVAGSNDFVWVGYGPALYELSAADGHQILTAPISGVITSISLDPTSRYLYVGSDACSAGTDGLVTQLNPVTLGFDASRPTGGGCLGGPGVSASKDGVWIGYATGMMGGIEHFLAVGLGVAPTSHGPTSNSISVVAVNNTVWALDVMAQRIECLDQQTGKAKATWELSNPAALAGDTQGVFLGDEGGLHLLRPDPRCQ